MKIAKIIPIIAILIILSTLSLALPENGEYPATGWDIARFSKVAGITDDGTVGAYIATTGDTELLCSPTKTITGTPLTVEIDDAYYTIIYGTNFVEARNEDCDNIADLTPALLAPVIAHKWDDDWHFLLPLTNKSILDYRFNASHFTLNQTVTLGSYVNNSIGACTTVSGFEYCFWQNTTNDLQRITLETGAVTPFAGITSPIDTTSRALAIREIGNGDRVVFTGTNGTKKTFMCQWKISTETLAAEFNGGECLLVGNSSRTEYSIITNPAIANIDGGTYLETAVVVGYVQGAAPAYNHYTDLYVYDGSGTVKYSASKQHTTGTSTLARRMNIYNPVLWKMDYGSTTDFAFCSIGEVEDSVGGNPESIALLCAGETQSYTLENNTVEECGWSGTADTVCRWTGASLDKNEGLLNDGDSYVQQGIGENKYVSIPDNQTFGNKAFQYPGQHISTPDIDGDSILDVVYTDGTELFIRLGLFNDNPPLWLTTPGAAIDADNIAELQLNSTYTIATLTNTAYFDQDGDLVRLFIDCEGDDSVNATSDYGASGLDNLQTTCTWDTAGFYTINVYLQDPYMANNDETTVLNRLTWFATVLAAGEEGSAPGSGLTYTGFPAGNATTRETPEDTVEDFTTFFDISTSWMLIIWLVCTIIILAYMAYTGIGSGVILGGTAFTSFIIAVFIGLIPVWISVLAGLMAAVTITVLLFRGGA